MSTDREQLIEEAAKAREAVERARAAFAVLEKAHTPTSADRLWSTADRREAKAEAERRFGEWRRTVDAETRTRGDASINAFILGAEWWKSLHGVPPAVTPGSGHTPTADEREALRDELAHWPIGDGYYQTSIGIDEASEIADMILAAGFRRAVQGEPCSCQGEYVTALDLVDGCKCGRLKPFDQMTDNECNEAAAVQGEPTDSGHDGWCGCETCVPEPQREPEWEQRARRAEGAIAEALGVVRSGSVPLGVSVARHYDRLLAEARRVLSDAVQAPEGEEKR